MSKASASLPYDEEYSHSVRTEKIANGYLKHSTVSGPDVKGGYARQTTFHRKDPLSAARRAQIARIHAKMKKRR